SPALRIVLLALPTGSPGLTIVFPALPTGSRMVRIALRAMRTALPAMRIGSRRVPSVLRTVASGALAGGLVSGRGGRMGGRVRVAAGTGRVNRRAVRGGAERVGWDLARVDAA